MSDGTRLVPLTLDQVVAITALWPDHEYSDEECPRCALLEAWRRAATLDPLDELVDQTGAARVALELIRPPEQRAQPP